MYQLTKNGNTVRRLSDGAIIPESEGNRDWQEYQDWLSVGNIPEPTPEQAVIIPKEITMRQARLGLLAIDKLTDIDGAVAGLGEAEQIEWQYAQTVKRDHPIVVELLPMLGLSDVEIDELFLSASQL